MKKRKITGGLLSLVLGAGLFVGVARANEGVYELQSVDGSGSSCYVLSVFEGRRYRINGSCRDLRTPYTAEQNRFVLWSIGEGGDSARIGEVKYGKIDGSIGDKFVGLMVTAESSATPRKPSESIVARGEWRPVPLIGGEAGKIVPTPTAAEEKVVKEQAGEVKEKGGVAKVFSAIGRIVGIGFLVLLVGVIVMTIITRRKERA